MKKISLMIILLLAFNFAQLSGEKTPLLTIKSPKTPLTYYFGKTYIELIQAKGYPNAIFPVRQSKKDWDDVVFDYDGSFYYLFNNRVYRVYFSSDYPGEIIEGLKIGDSKGDLIEVFGSKYKLGDDGYLWQWNDLLIMARIKEKNRLANLWVIMEVDK